VKNPFDLSRASRQDSFLVNESAQFCDLALNCDATRSAPDSGSAGAPRAFAKSIHLGRSHGPTSALGRRPSAKFLPPQRLNRRAKGPVYNEEIAIGRDEGPSFEKMTDCDGTRSNEEAS
jgi:hypothetical protein